MVSVFAKLVFTELYSQKFKRIEKVERRKHIILLHKMQVSYRTQTRTEKILAVYAVLVSRFEET